MGPFSCITMCSICENIDVGVFLAYLRCFDYALEDRPCANGITTSFKVVNLFQEFCAACIAVGFSFSYTVGNECVIA